MQCAQPVRRLRLLTMLITLQMTIMFTLRSSAQMGPNHLTQLLTIMQPLLPYNAMKQILEAIKLMVKTLWPKSRWGNLIYLVVGFILSQYDVLLDLWQAILAVIK